MSWTDAARGARSGAVRGLTAAAEHLLAASTKLAPYENQTLIESAAVDVDPADLAAAVSYDTEYAIDAHEDLRLRHDPGREAKYLERPLHTEARTMLDLIADGVRRGLH